MSSAAPERMGVNTLLSLWFRLGNLPP